MTIDIRPETERLVQEEIRRGHFQSVDQIILEGLSAWREKHAAEATDARPAKRIYDLLTQPPFAGSSLEIGSQREYLKEIG